MCIRVDSLNSTFDDDNNNNNINNNTAANGNITIEFMFAGLAARAKMSLRYHFGGHWENKN